MRQAIIATAVGLGLIGGAAGVATVAVPTTAITTQYDARAREMLAPTVRIRNGQSTGSGTGILAGNIGTIIVTNNHVVSGAENGRVVVQTFNFGRGANPTLDAQLTGVVLTTDAERDLALVLVPGHRLPTARMAADTGDMSAGDEVFAVGSPLGLRPYITRGLLSLQEELLNHQRWIMTSTDVLPGNSGGGLYRLRNGRYEFIGVPSMIRVLGFAPVPSVNYSVPVEAVRDLLNANGLRIG